MRSRGDKGHGKCYGSATVGPRGQLVIPMEARRELGIETGARFLVFRHPMGEGIWLLEAGAVESLLARMGQRMAQLEKEVRKYRKAGGRGEP